MQAGPRNLITDVPGLLVGNAHCQQLKSGVTVLTAAQPFVASVDVMGGAPGTREIALLEPDKFVSQIDALVLSGGSAFGLDAASGVANTLKQQNKGFAVGSTKVPIVPAAILFDLINGGDKQWRQNPYSQLGSEALTNCTETFELGSVGAGTGAMVATLKGGLGSASLTLASGVTIGALVAVNAVGDAVVPTGSEFWAAPWEINDEFGGRGVAAGTFGLSEPSSEKLSAMQVSADTHTNTTIGIVATDATLTKSQLKRLAVASQDGFARALVPAHTLLDGDLMFSLATGQQTLNDPVSDALLLGHAASVCVSRAIARAVFHASAHRGDLLPTWQQKFNA
ncbi:MAG: P1 family peptidase [Gammaproteobacteria bacterium]|nr:P1 family peptidase [Gammaproteobacteria bacterium]